jgi:ubiquinone/menaquinone biosynthesis C-methylase UbiE
MAAKRLSRQDKQIIGPAQKYERKKVPAIFQPLAEQFIGSLPLEEGQAVLDVACGTGIVVRVVADRLRSPGRLDGVDIDAEMIDVARSSTADNDRIAWHVGSAEQMPFLENKTFDWVLCQQGFQWFQDRIGALGEMHRVLRPGGRLAMIMWTRVAPDTMPFFWTEVELVRKYGGDEAAERRVNLTPFFKGTQADLEALLLQAGFEHLQLEDRVFLRQKGPPEALVTVADYQDLPSHAQEIVVAELRQAAEAYRTPQGTEIPYGYHFVQGTRV